MRHIACGGAPGGRRAWLAGALLAVHAALLAWHGATMSPVGLEVAHLPAGISHWKFRRYELYRQNPPLVRMVGALPVLAVGAKYDWSAYDVAALGTSLDGVGRSFVKANGERIFWLYKLARWACIPFSLVGAWVAYKWAGELYGRGAGLLALSLYAFCPNLVGHGALLMPDAPSAALGLAASYTFWKWLKAPAWHGAILAGFVLGAAELTKTTLIVLVPIWPVLWVAYRLAEKKPIGRRGWLREAGMMAVRYGLAWFTLNAGYLFVGAFKPLGEYEFRSQALAGIDRRHSPLQQFGNRFKETWLANVPVPLPADYVQGIDFQRYDLEHDHSSYLRGELRRQGRWDYYLYVLAVKTPLGTLALLGLALWLSAWRRQATFRDELLLLAPAAAILALVSSQTGLNEHGRYVWPAIPYFYVFAGQAARLVLRASPKAATLVLGLAAASAGSMLWHCPYSVSYFNELAGGPKNGHAHLLGSNFAWGQDLLHLKRWYDDHPDARSLFLLYASPFDPSYAGIRYNSPPPVPRGAKPRGAESDGAVADRAFPCEPGWYAVDVCQLRIPGTAEFYGEVGAERPVYERARRIVRELSLREPDAMAGYSIFIYKVTEEAAAADARGQGPGQGP